MGVAEGSTHAVVVKAEDLTETLGPPRFESESAMRSGVPGVVTGLAWTPIGGDILFIEASRVPGSGKLILTGQLGEVMKESAQAALSLLKRRLDELDVSGQDFEQHDIHIHVPARATPKDGPSAAIAIFVALASLFTGRPARSDAAMTGAISLRGLGAAGRRYQGKGAGCVARRHHHGASAFPEPQGMGRDSAIGSRQTAHHLDRPGPRGPHRSSDGSAGGLKSARGRRFDLDLRCAGTVSGLPLLLTFPDRGPPLLQTQPQQRRLEIREIADRLPFYQPPGNQQP